MLATRLSSLAPRLVFSPAPRPVAAWFVPLAAVGCLVVLVAFVTKYSSRTPFHDEYAYFHYLFGGATAADYWAQHNEHRIPLPRVLYVAAVKLAGTDFRAPLALNVVLLAAATVAVLMTLRARRGRFAVSDAAVPLLLLGTQHFDNLLWGFQVQFVLSTALVLAALALIAWPGSIAVPGRFVALAAVAAALPLCGANGAPPGVALAGLLVVVGARNVGSARAAAGVGLVGGIAAAGVVIATFVGLNRVPQPAGSVAAFLSGLVNLPGFGFGPAAYMPHGEAYDGVTAAGVLTTHFLLATAVMLVRVVRTTPAERDRALALLALLAGIAALAAGISYGRSGHPRGVFAGRYVTLFTPGLVVAYFAWVCYGRTRYIPVAVAVIAAALAIPNARFAAGVAEVHSARLKRVEHEARTGLPVGIVADRNPWLFPGEPDGRRVWLDTLRTRGVPPFDSLIPDAALTAEVVPVRVARVDGVIGDAAGYRVTGQRGGVVFQLPTRRHVYAVRLTYRAERPGGTFARSVVSWDRDGRIPPAPGYGIIDALDLHTAPAQSVVLVDRETDVLRLDLFEPGTTFRVDAIELLSAPR
ncbi:MAG: hypothetical protein U0804_14280 [Gemmataceae bacterium]